MGGKAVADPLSQVDPELRSAAQSMASGTDAMSKLSMRTLAAARAMYGEFPAPLPTITVEKRAIAGPRGAPEVIIYIINADPGMRRPAILHIHGGGYVLGSAAAEVRRLQEIAATLDCVIVTVEYRLAPEARYADSTEDLYAALGWLFGHGEALGVETARIALMGESAGGGHAALLAIAARDRGEFPIAFQCLIYPMLDDRSGSTRQPPPHIGQIIWTPAANRFGWSAFLGQEAGGPSVPRAAVPARTSSLEGLPPTFIGVGAIDLFVEEDIDYAKRLVQAGVPTELLVVPGAFHGFDLLASPEAGIVKAFNAAKLNALRRGLAP